MGKVAIPGFASQPGDHLRKNVRQRFLGWRPLMCMLATASNTAPKHTEVGKSRASAQLAVFAAGAEACFCAVLGAATAIGAHRFTVLQLSVHAAKLKSTISGKKKSAPSINGQDATQVGTGCFSSDVSTFAALTLSALAASGVIVLSTCLGHCKPYNFSQHG